MKILRIVIAAILTLALLYVARNTSEGRPEYVEGTDGDFTFEMTTVPKHLENDTAAVSVTVTGPFEEGVFVQMRPYLARYGESAPERQTTYGSLPMKLSDSANGVWSGRLQTISRGHRHYFSFEVRDRLGGLRATFEHPEGRPFMMKHIGDVPGFILIPHILLMFATVFTVFLATTHAFSLVSGNDNVGPFAKLMLWAVVFVFMGGGPFGWAMNYYAFGTVWEGVPFGTDATDNKTQLLFVYLLFVLLSALGSLSKGKWGRDLYSPRTLGGWGIGAVLIMLAIYLIPHSIQFSAHLTYIVCYSFIGVVALFYLIPLLLGRSKQPQV